jgi:hypothetical protein
MTMELLNGLSRSDHVNQPRRLTCGAMSVSRRRSWSPVATVEFEQGHETLARHLEEKAAAKVVQKPSKRARVHELSAVPACQQRMLRR